MEVVLVDALIGRVALRARTGTMRLEPQETRILVAIDRLTRESEFTGGLAVAAELTARGLGSETTCSTPCC